MSAQCWLTDGKCLRDIDSNIKLNNNFPLTIVPALGLGFFISLHPGLAPTVGEVNQQNQLDEDKQESADQTDPHPSWK